MMTSTILRHRVAVLLILLGAFLLRIHTLDLNPLWFDESMEYWVATSSSDNLLPAVRESLQDPPLYSALLHFWMGLGRDEFTLRFPSLIASVLAVAATFAFAKQVHSQMAGTLGALLVALAPPSIRFAQEVGQYALLGFVLTLNLLLALHARRKNRWSYWIAWVATGLACVYTYYGSLFILFGVGGAIVLESIFRRGLRQVIRPIVACVALAGLILPLALFWIPVQLFRGPTTGAFQLAFTSLGQEAFTILNETKSLFAYQLTGTISDPTRWVILQWVAALLILVALTVGVVEQARSPKRSYVVLWLLSCWSVYYGAGRLGLYPYAGTRHSLIFTPLLITFVAVGLAVFWRQRMVAGAVLLLGITVLALMAPAEAPEDLRTVAAHYIAARVRCDADICILWRRARFSLSAGTSGR